MGNVRSQRQFAMGLAGTAIVGGLLMPGAAMAQIVPDATLGNEASTVTPDSPIRGANSDLIEGGAVRGDDLFHSFEDFNVNDLQRVYFANPAAIDSIFSRVTGNNISEILGTLGVDGDADLYFLNPNGIVFGENAQLDIAGSLFVSTADGFNWGEGLVYSATDPNAPPLLAVSLTPGLQLSATQRAIENSGSLSVGEDLTLASGELTLTGELLAGETLSLLATDTVEIRDSQTQPFIASAGDSLLVEGNNLIDIFALSHPDSGLFSGADMVLRSDNTVIGDAHYFSGGSFRIEQLDGSAGNLTSPNDPVILAVGDVGIGDYQDGASLHVLAGGSIILGNVVINQTGSVDDTIGPNSSNPLFQALSAVTLSDGSTAVIDGATRPTLDVRAGIDWSQFPGFPGGSIETPPGSVGPIFNPTPNGSLILIGNVDARRENAAAFENSNIFITNQFNRNAALPTDAVTSSVSIGNINASTGQEQTTEIVQAGDVVIDSFGNVSTRNISTFVDSDSEGIAGGIVIRSATGSIDTTAAGDPTEGTLVSSAGRGFANFIVLQAAGDIDLGNIETFTNGPFQTGTLLGIPIVDIINDPNNTAVIPSGLSGNIAVESGATVRLGDGNLINTRGIDGVNGGNVSIRGNEILLDDGLIISDTSPFPFNATDPGALGISQAGDILLETQSLTLVNGAEVLTRSFNGGAAGNVEVRPIDENLPSSVLIDGVVDIETDLATGAYVGGGFSSGLFSTAEETSRATERGSVRVTTNTLTLTNGGVISARTRSENAAAGSNVFINVDELNLMSGGQILAVAFGNGAAGDIDVVATNSVNISGIDNQFNQRQIDTLRAQFIRLTNGGAVFEDAYVDSIDATDFTLDPVAPNSGIYANNRVNFDTQGVNNIVVLQPRTDGIGKPGDITVTAPQITLADAGQVSASTGRSEDSGDIDLTTQSLTLRGGGRIFAQTYGEGEGGNIRISPQDIDQPSQVVIDGVAPVVSEQITIGGNTFIRPFGGFSSGLITSTEDQDILYLEDPFVAIGNNLLSEIDGVRSTTGAGGSIFIEDIDAIEVTDGGVLTARSRSIGSGGDIVIRRAETVSLRDGGQAIVGALDYRRGEAGNLTIDATADIEVVGQDDAFLTRRENLQDSYQAYLTALLGNTILLSGQTQLDATLLAEQRAPIATAFIIDPIRANSGLIAQAGINSAGSGDIQVTTSGSLRLGDSGQIASDTFGLGAAGDIELTIAENVELSEFSSISSQIAARGGSEAVLLPNGEELQRPAPLTERNRININARALSVDSSSSIAAGTFGRGDVGTIEISTAETINVGGSSSIRGSVETGGVGDGGDINLASPRLNLTGGGQIQSGVFRAQEFNGALIPGGQGDGGSINVDVADVTIDGLSPDGLRSGLFVSTEQGAVGDAGIIRIGSEATPTESLRVTNNGIINASTSNSSNAGGVSISVDTLRLEAGGLVSVNGTPLGTTGVPGNPGNINIAADNVGLFQGGKIQATTASIENSGNINLTIDGALVLQGTQTAIDPSGTCPTCNLISTEAFGIGATGGNITILTNSVSGNLFQNSDIVANAEGTGGAVQLLANNSLGRFIGSRPLGEIFTLRGGRSLESDLDASSTLTVNDGTVETGEQQDVQEVTIPDIIDPTDLVDQRCDLLARQQTNASAFTVTGRGGLPLAPDEQLDGSGLLEDFGPLVTPQDEVVEPADNDASALPSVPEIIAEPQGWTITEAGQLLLYGSAETTEPLLNGHCRQSPS
ncbi:MAG: filamentous hemagglutinin N-terminal domain-containing protein [Cyanobacteria bacterium P01_A01_bin.137]